MVVKLVGKPRKLVPGLTGIPNESRNYLLFIRICFRGYYCGSNSEKLIL